MQTTLKNNNFIIKVQSCNCSHSQILLHTKEKWTTLKYTNVCYKIATIKYFCKQKKTETYM